MDLEDAGPYNIRENSVNCGQICAYSSFSGRHGADSYRIYGQGKNIPRYRRAGFISCRIVKWQGYFGGSKTPPYSEKNVTLHPYVEQGHELNYSKIPLLKFFDPNFFTKKFCGF